MDREDGEDVEEITCPNDQPLGGISDISTALCGYTPCSAIPPIPSSFAGNAAQQEAGVVSPIWKLPVALLDFLAPVMHRSTRKLQQLGCAGYASEFAFWTSCRKHLAGLCGAECLNYPYHLHALVAAKRVPSFCLN